ncbi:clavesin-1-like [Frankliniella occidentalis]|uniref:Clavesin-1-like n=1 Tax=Frankliniella occidentalis TaxID=133901 RepID=A0A6J1S3A5_FRAOC|nr:clavesin-1-like [Frankliniella occidentalis]
MVASTNVPCPVLPEGWRVPAELRKKVLAKLETNDDRLAKDAETLRAWVNMQPHLPHLPESELYMLKQYLVYSKNSMEKAKRGLDTYYTARSAHWDFFGSFNIDEERMKRYASLMQIGMSKELTANLHRILFVRTTPEELTPQLMDLLCSINLLKADIILRLDTCLGFEVIIDLANYSSNHAKIMAMSLTTMKNYLTCTLNALPVRVKHLHFVNAPSMFTTTFSLIQPMLKEKLRKRVLMHKSLKSLYAHVSPQYLPRDMGGELPSTEEMEVELRKIFLGLSDIFAFQRTLKTDESRRPGGPSEMHGNTFGCEGSFRSISLD